MKKNIVLIGMPGSGKTTLGGLLSKELSLDFCDIDNFIEESEGTSISEIFKLGEPHFRNIESKAVEKVSKAENLVISTGGGVIKAYHNIELLSENGIIIFINRPIEHIIRDLCSDSRPLLKNNEAAIFDLYNERYSLYKDYCDYEILNDMNISDAIIKIKELLVLDNK